VLDVAPLDVAELPHAVAERRKIPRHRRLGAGMENADALELIRRLLRARRERPCNRAAEQRDELAPLHSITSSARASSVAGTSRPRAFAVFRLIRSSIMVTRSIGRSAGRAPLRILSTKIGARR